MIFSNIINAFTATLDQFNTSLLKKSIKTWLQTYSDIQINSHTIYPK